MWLKHVTFTGADEQVDPKDLVAIRERHRYVEFGILVESLNQSKGRYPDLEWIGSLKDLDLELSLHLCSGLAEQFILDLDPRPLLQVERMTGAHFRRIQCNISKSDFQEINWDRLMCSGLVTRRSVIIQSRDNFAGAHEILARRRDDCLLSLIADSSGGNGQGPQFWPWPVPDLFCGYAGGIGPHNVIDVLKTLDLLAMPDQDLWIDMETHIRENNQFSIERVEQVLEAIEKEFAGSVPSPMERWVAR